MKGLFAACGVTAALTALLLVGCSLPSWLVTGPTPSTTLEAQLATTATPAAEAQGSPPAAVPEVITLTIWTTARYSPGEATSAAGVLAAQAEAFRAAYPGFHLDWVVKPTAGPGNLVEFLLSAQDVAPTVLPDIIVLDTRHLGTVMRSGLLQPLTSLISDEVEADLFPFAQQAGIADNQRYAIQFTADIEHVIYNSQRVAAPPLTWTDVLSDGLPYAFPAGGQDGMVNDMLLIQYLALGGRLTGDNQQPVLDEGPLTQVLSFYAEGLKAQLFPAAITTAAGNADVLPLYEDGEVVLSNITSALYLTLADDWPDTAFATLPTWNGTVATMARGQALALVTVDSRRQEAARAFNDWFLAPERNLAWARAAGHLPTRSSLLEAWDVNKNYAAFVRWQLQSAYHIPSTPEYQRIYTLLQSAVHDVLAGTTTPEEAARRAVALAAGGN
jgi:maltose-binding protein MalE